MITRTVLVAAAAAAFVSTVSTVGAVSPAPSFAQASPAAPASGAQAKPSAGASATPTAPAVAQPPAAARPPAVAPAAAPGVTPPADYVIGAEDVLQIVHWRDEDKKYSAEVTVRPDGKITLSLLGDVQAAGLTPEQLDTALTNAYNETVFKDGASLSVAVKEIRSRKISISGEVAKTGVYPLLGPTTVFDVLTMAGGVTPYAKSNRILIIRREGGKDIQYKFNLKDFGSGKNTKQNIELKPGDKIFVP